MTEIIPSIPILLYGIQRSSTNYTQQLIQKNFKNVRICNKLDPRCFPTHKHFRLYNEKFIIPEPLYYNDFIYPDFESFKHHVERLLATDIQQIIVTIKHPYSWYVSYTRHAKNNKYFVHKRSFNSHFILDYNFYYKKWLDFQKEASDIVKIIRYEDLLKDPMKFIHDFGKRIELSPDNEKIENPSKVGMSKKFTNKRLKYYMNKEYMEKLKPEDLEVIKEILDDELIQLYDIE